MEIHLVDTVDLEKISMNKPKKNGLYMVSKPKYSDNELMIQMPKMNLSLESQEENTQVFLDFLNKKEYSKKVYDFLNTLDSKIILNIFKNSEEWFGKKIPMEKLTEMYSGTLINIFSESNETERKETSTRIKVNINKKETSLIDKKNNELELSDYKNNSTVECICRLKYIVFSKDKCVPVWEIVVMKLIVKVNRVPKNAFIEDNSDNDSIEEYSFF